LWKNQEWGRTNGGFLHNEARKEGDIINMGNQTGSTDAIGYREGVFAEAQKDGMLRKRF